MTDVLRDLVEQTAELDEPTVTTGSTGECAWPPADEETVA
jgi:hypothetical protein